MQTNLETLTHARACNRVNDSTEFLIIGCTPIEENCQQAGFDPEDKKYSRLECKVYASLLLRSFPEVPEGCEYFILENLHEFGYYYELAIFYPVYPTDSPEYLEDLQHPGELYALNREEGLNNWDHISISELREGGHPLYKLKEPAKIIHIKTA